VPFHVEFERKAERDIATAERFLLQVGTASLARWRTRLVRVVQNLERDPHRFPEAAEAADLGVDLRESLFGRRRHVYRVLFTVVGTRVIVHRIRHAAQDWITADDL
jgi:plasmid stabilization system protein ParE